MTQFYTSVAKLLGLSETQGHGEVTWQHFVDYLLATSPEKDVSELQVGSSLIESRLRIRTGNPTQTSVRPA